MIVEEVIRSKDCIHEYYVNDATKLQSYVKALLSKIKQETGFVFKIDKTDSDESVFICKNDNLANNIKGKLPMTLRIQFVISPDKKSLKSVLCMLTIDDKYKTNDLHDVGYPYGVSFDNLLSELKKYKSILANNEIVTSVKQSDAVEKKICCICGKEFEGYGNNPAPVKKTGECCNECNEKYVVPKRLSMLAKHNVYSLDAIAHDKTTNKVIDNACMQLAYGSKDELKALKNDYDAIMNDENNEYVWSFNITRTI